MEHGTFSTCTLCVCIKYDTVYNSNALTVMLELFPELPTPEYPLFCRDCTSMLEIYHSIKLILTEYIASKYRDSNELNIANFIMWSNEETNDINNEEKKCQICSKSITDSNNEDGSLISELFPDLDLRFCSNIKVCINCKNLMYNLKTFKMGCHNSVSDVVIKIEDTEIDYRHCLSSPCASNYYEDHLILTPTNDKKIPLDVPNEINYKMFMVETVETEIKTLKRNGVNLYKCPKCEKLVLDINNHLEEHKDLLSSVLYGCETCNFRSKSLNNMKTHLCNIGKRNTTVEELFRCKICSFSSKQKGNLKTHMLVHKSPDDIPMYKCLQCNFQSRQKGNLKTHALVHRPREEIKMYKCNYCLFEARQKGNLQTHMLKKHISINDVMLDKILYLKCKVCPFKTKQKKTFKKHMENHNES